MILRAVQTEQYCTYEEWLELEDGNRYELHNGRLFMMAGPSQQHAEISTEMSRQIANFLIDKPCRVYHAPFDVRLYEYGDTVYQPDLLVVCDSSKLDGKRCIGAPDFIVEVLSDSTSGIDKVAKFNDYLRSGVREYWIVDPKDKTVTAFRLMDEIYSANVYSNSNIAPVQVLPGCEIDLSLVFRD